MFLNIYDRTNMHCDSTFPGVTTFGALARIGDGKFDGETSYIETVIDKKGGPHKEVKTTGILEQHFLRPKPVLFAHRPAITPKVIAVSCGVNHLLVVARDPTSSHGNLYSSGLNCSGQLGHGDDVDRHSLTLVCSRLPPEQPKPFTDTTNRNLYVVIPHNIAG